LAYIFKGFCTIGSPVNGMYMKSSQFLRFLMETDMVSQKGGNGRLKLNDVDALFMKLSNKNPDKKGINAAKIDFNAFILGIELIARLLNHNQIEKELLDSLIKNNIVANLDRYIERAREMDINTDYFEDKQTNKELNELLEILGKFLQNVFLSYSDKYNTIDFEGFIK
jgi:hypothetical protein